MVFKEQIATVPGKEGHKATELGIDVIRQEIIEKVGMKPLIGRNKVFIILDAELMSRAAQNALLKTLEEPPPNTYLFLISEHLGRPAADDSLAGPGSRFSSPAGILPSRPPGPGGGG
jgi:hypothetical protein